MIGVGVLTYDRPEQFSKVLNSIKGVDYVVGIKDGGKPSYTKIPNVDFYEMKTNIGVGACKNVALEILCNKGCDHIFLVEDDCLITDNVVWKYCIEFSKESGLFHFNWNDYRYGSFARAKFQTHFAILSNNTEANFSYFRKEFVENIKFDEKFVNAWEHVDLEMQGCEKGFLPPFRTFICPADLGKCLKLIDNNISTISGKDNYNQRVTEGFTYFTQKWGKSVNDIVPVPMDEFYEKMKKITLKYAERAN
jgi:GT2 family glycosyltransferase